MSRLTDKIKAAISHTGTRAEQRDAWLEVLADVQELEQDLADATAIADAASDRNVAAIRNAKRQAYVHAQELRGQGKAIQDAIDAFDAEGEGT